MRCILFAVALATMALCANATILAHHAGRRTIKSSDDVRGLGYGLVMRFIAAVHFNNVTEMANLLADDGAFKATDISCGTFTKAEFLALLATDNDVAVQVIPKTWIETDDGLTIISAEQGSIKRNNETVYVPQMFLAAVPSADGTRIQVLEKWADRTHMQANASSMLAVSSRLVDAANLADIKPWEEILRSDFNFTLSFRFDAAPAEVMNRSTTLARLRNQYDHIISSQVIVGTMYASCDFVVGDFWGFVRTTISEPLVQRYFFSMRLDSDYKASNIWEYSLGLIPPL